MEALAFLSGAKAKPGPLYVLHGDEAFLKRHVLRTLRQRVLGDEADDQAITTYAGDTAVFADVFDDLDTVPFFYAKRFVIIDNADKFVTRYRGELEKKLTQLPASGVLVLDVKAWAANTRLAKMIDTSATIVCKAPATWKMASWCSEWCTTHYQKQLPAPAASLLVDLVGPEMGLLDQELLKLSVYVGAKPKIEVADVDRLVGNSREENTWKIFDAIAAGNVKDALAILHRLFDQGEEPMRLAGAFSSQLRKLAQAARLHAHGVSPTAALEQAGVAPFGLKNAETQLRHLGRQRLDQLFDWLVRLNMDLRGGSPLPPRAQFERLVLKLARKT